MPAETVSMLSGIAKRALQYWDCITGAPVLVMHRENAVFKVATTRGFAALRVHRPGYHSHQEIKSELQWMAKLAEAGLQVPTPFLTKDGAFVAEVHDDQQQAFEVDLLAWLEGDPLGASKVPLRQTKEQLEGIFFNLGHNMARMHEASDQWQLPNGFQRHALDKEGLIGETAAWGRFWEATCLSKDEKHVMTEARHLAAQRLDSLLRSGVDYGLIHADLVRENILVSGTETRLIDFDDAGFGFRMFDIAVALVKNREEPHYDSMKSKLFGGYKSVRALSPCDEDLLDLFLALRDFAYLGWADARRDEPLIAPRLQTIKSETLSAARIFLAHG